MNNNKRLGLGLSVLLIILLGVFFVLPRLIFSDGQKIKMPAERPYIPGRDTTRITEPPRQEIRQVFEYRWNRSLDSCDYWDPFLWQIRFDPLPELNKPSKIYVSLKSCWEADKKAPRLDVYADENLIDYTQIEPKWLPPIKKGDIFDGCITIVPRDIGKYMICIFELDGPCFILGFDENGELVHLSDRGSFPISDLPNHPAITEKEIYVKFNGQYVTNLFHITPPLSLNDTSMVYYRVVTKVDYPDGMKIVTRDHHNIKFKMLPGPITKRDTLEGSFKVLPSQAGWNSIGLGIEEPPRDGVKPKNDSFSAQYHLLKDGKLLYVVKSQEEYEAFYEYYKKKGVELEKY